jgi:hypothetical protein
MFNEQNQEPEDMLSSLGNEKTNPVNANPNPVPQALGVNSQLSGDRDLKKMESELMSDGGGEKKSPLMPIVIGLIIVLVLVGGYFAYMQFGYLLGNSANPEVIVEEEIVNEIPGIEQIEVQKVEEIVTELPQDSDRDGLSDAEEEALGTDKNHVDSDRDGINDNAEVNIYKTNPLKDDTDGDGYLDGNEIINNYDPLDPAPGKALFSIDEELNKTDTDLK